MVRFTNNISIPNYTMIEGPHPLSAARWVADNISGTCTSFSICLAFTAFVEHALISLQPPSFHHRHEVPQSTQTAEGMPFSLVLHSSILTFPFLYHAGDIRWVGLKCALPIHPQHHLPQQHTLQHLTFPLAAMT